MKIKSLAGLILLLATFVSGAYAEVATSQDNVNTRERRVRHQSTEVGGVQNAPVNQPGAGTPPATTPATGSTLSPQPVTTLSPTGAISVTARPLLVAPLPIVAPPPATISTIPVVAPTMLNAPLMTVNPVAMPIVAPVVAPVAPPIFTVMPILPVFVPPPIVIPPPPMIVIPPPIIQIPIVYVPPPRIYVNTRTVAASDRRLKRNIHRIGTHRLGIGIYEFDYVWGEHAIGVMADEVRKVMPEAVIRGEDGYDRVDYSKLN